MKTYIGTKIIQAEPQSKDHAEGYKVVYEDGYESWSPKDVFEKAYVEISTASVVLIEVLKNNTRQALALDFNKDWQAKIVEEVVNSAVRIGGKISFENESIPCELKTMEDKRQYVIDYTALIGKEKAETRKIKGVQGLDITILPEDGAAEIYQVLRNAILNNLIKEFELTIGSENIGFTEFNITRL